MFNATGQIFIVLNGQRLKNNPAGHTVSERAWDPPVNDGEI